MLSLQIVVLAMSLAAVMASGSQGQFHGRYGGRCDRDGFYYKDQGSLVICSNNNAYVQPCAPGTRNSNYNSYTHGGHYHYRDFCDVNLVDYGYGVRHGYGGGHGSHGGSYGGHRGSHGGHGSSFGGHGSHGGSFGHGGAHGGHGNAFGHGGNSYGHGGNSFGHGGHGAGFGGHGRHGGSHGGNY